MVHLHTIGAFTLLATAYFVNRSDGVLNGNIVSQEEFNTYFSYSVYIYIKYRIREKLANGDQEITDIPATCTGGLISRKHIISTAHCFVSHKDDNTIREFLSLKAIFGTNNPLGKDQGVMKNVYGLYIPDQYFKDRTHDIAILSLQDDLPIEEYNIISLKFPKWAEGERVNQELFTEGHTFVTAGYGIHKADPITDEKDKDKVIGYNYQTDDKLRSLEYICYGSDPSF